MPSLDHTLTRDVSIRKHVYRVEGEWRLQVQIPPIRGTVSSDPLVRTFDLQSMLFHLGSFCDCGTTSLTILFIFSQIRTIFHGDFNKDINCGSSKCVYVVCMWFQVGSVMIIRLGVIK